MALQLKRIYDAPAKSDGYRVLVDRLWPRGVSKARAAIDEWLKDVAPSPDLRKWFGHKPERFDEFKARYKSELDSNPAVKDLAKIIKDHRTVTLVYAAKDPKINHVVVLKEFMAKH
jgi:uncharacterized protein YeaO (DUF488 family)